MAVGYYLGLNGGPSDGSGAIALICVGVAVFALFKLIEFLAEWDNY